MNTLTINLRPHLLYRVLQPDGTVSHSGGVPFIGQPF
jgi:hypothetical protein